MASYAKKNQEALAKPNQTQRIVATWLLFASHKVRDSIEIKVNVMLTWKIDCPVKEKEVKTSKGRTWVLCRLLPRS